MNASTTPINVVDHAGIHRQTDMASVDQLSSAMPQRITHIAMTDKYFQRRGHTRLPDLAALLLAASRRELALRKRELFAGPGRPLRPATLARRALAFSFCLSFCCTISSAVSGFGFDCVPGFVDVPGFVGVPGCPTFSMLLITCTGIPFRFPQHMYTTHTATTARH